MSNRSFYHDRRWEHKRRRILRRDKYRCRECARYGRARDAETVHHMHPLEESPELGLSDWNLLSLCGECHNKMHDRKIGKLTALGEHWRRKAHPPTFDPSTDGGGGLGKGKSFQ